MATGYNYTVHFCVIPLHYASLHNAYLCYVFSGYASLHYAYSHYMYVYFVMATCVLHLSIMSSILYLLALYLIWSSLYASLYYEYSPLAFFSNCWPLVTGLVLDVSITQLAKCLIIVL